MGKTQSKPLVERHGNGMVCVNPPLVSILHGTLELRKQKSDRVAVDEPQEGCVNEPVEHS
jgi:hypothetical protein